MTIENFPIRTQLGIFHNTEEIATWLLYQNNSEIYAYDYCKLIKYAPFIYTSFTEECFSRYGMLKNYQINSFSKLFDELPAWWVDMINLIDNEIIKARGWLQKQPQNLK